MTATPEDDRCIELAKTWRRRALMVSAIAAAIFIGFTIGKGDISWKEAAESASSLIGVVVMGFVGYIAVMVWRQNEKEGKK